MRWSYIIVGVLFILLCAYLDNSRSVLLPFLTDKFQLNYSQASMLLVAVGAGAFSGSLSLLIINQYFSERVSSLLACALALCAIAGTFVVHDYYGLLAFFYVLGAGIVMFGTICSVLIIYGTVPKYRSQAMCGLHMMYGFGSFFGPQVTGVLVEGGSRWSAPFFYGLPAIVVCLLIIIFAFRQKNRMLDVTVRRPRFRLTSFERSIGLAFALYTSSEVMIAMWLPTYLVASRGFSLSTAGSYTAGFFLVLGVTRGLCLLPLKEERERDIGALSVAIAALFFCLGCSGWLPGFVLAGICGPYFPLLLARASRAAPERASAIAIWVVGCNQVSVAILHIVMGQLADGFGIQVAYLLPACTLTIAILAFRHYLAVEAKLSTANW